ncbi:argininosuccinate lyase [Thermoplasma volcanium GSS1]|uniref:Argininosuccinate lyase n=1 Tax=Thermoplasma volcanium (strain ATCC 51530 / DSM 4299 / JCM 9571 / NBRC 15438 / GSS1) TaxID=273116 RepID=Q97A54_THEVO|nr:lyase family protein [Thermoplasma volcanium]BAB60098.1 argininosuccinate lyase [Thermoplasma volcanium GSS1]
MKIWQGGAAKPSEYDPMEYLVKLDVSADTILEKYEIINLMAYHYELIKIGIINEEDGKCLLNALIKAYEGKITIDVKDEDVHTAIENWVKGLCPKNWENLRLFLSRNEQVHADMILYLLDSFYKMNKIFQSCIEKTIGVNGEGYLPGYTHFQQAMPFTFKSFMNSVLLLLERNILNVHDFFQKIRINVYGYGSGYGSPISAKFDKMGELLGLRYDHKNPIFLSSLYPQTLLEASQLIVTIMMPLSRLSSDTINYYSRGIMDIPDEFTTGSSLMPNKRNPDYLEMIQGLAAESVGVSSSIASIALNKQIGYHRDFQIAKDSIVFLIEKLIAHLDHLPDLLGRIEFFKEASERAVENSSYATMNAWNAFFKGTRWKEAYARIGNMVRENNELEKVDFETPTDNLDIANTRRIIYEEKYIVDSFLSVPERLKNLIRITES